MWSEDLFHDLAHPHQGLLVEALGQADDDLVFAQDGRHPAVNGPAELGGDGDEDDIGERSRFPEVVRKPDGFRKQKSGQKDRVLP